jgi:hypothetical protein
MIAEPEAADFVPQKVAPPLVQTRPLCEGEGRGRNKMPLRGKVIITCAVTGSIHTPTMSHICR